MLLYLVYSSVVFAILTHDGRTKDVCMCVCVLIMLLLLGVNVLDCFRDS